MSYLVLVRHGESEWNEKGLWTGWANPSLTRKGRRQAKEAGEKLKDISFDFAYTSALKRTHETLEEIKNALERPDLLTIGSDRINERDYGDLTGKNKWEIKEQYGDEQFMKWRRSWDSPLPNGESLKDVYHRVIPYYEKEILPKLKSGKNVIICSSGNALRSLVKYLDNISDDDIQHLEIGIGEVLVYTIDNDGNVISKETRQTDPNKGNV